MPTLSFKGKTAVENYHHTVPHHVLEIDKGLSVSKKPSLEDNLIIEGDNLLALKSLLPTHAGRIKCIYIDPPYNTGNEGWVYNDNLTQPQFKDWIGKTVGKEGEDATRHDKWCCMMVPRLALLKELLREDGAIFVSIDDNEVANLRFMMDEVFGADRFIGQIVWKSRLSEDARNVSGLSTDHEYVLAYGSYSSTALRGAEKDLTKFSNPDRDPRGDWRSADLTGLATRARRPNLHYDLIDPKTRTNYGCPPMGWRFDRETMKLKIAEGRILFPRDREGRPRHKLFKDEMKSLFKNRVFRHSCG